MSDVTAPALAASPLARTTTDTIVAAQRGDPSACRAIVASHQRSVHALVWRMLGVRGRPDLVEDLVQEAFLRIFRALPRFAPSGRAKFSTWLLTIVTRTAIDELRRPFIVRGPQPESLASPTETPAEASERASTGRAIARAVEGLGPEIRATFVLRAYHDLSHAEIAEALRVDVGTVKSRLWRARQALQRELEGMHHRRARTDPHAHDGERS
jgi:RNA polymerase sigma-70 factor, ECF subfamily